MYLTFFGLAEKPFAITPDPRYLYLSARHADALAHLVYGINEAGGFIQLTGEVGTGKTTTIRSLLARAPKNAEIALILNPRLSPAEFLRSLCEELGLGMSDSAENNHKELVDMLNRYLLRMHAQGRRVVLIVDEAQNLSPEVLEQIRLLTNLETETQKLLQIILIGQPELRALLEREDLRQLAQRITGRYHLDPLSREESVAYVRHRLRVAGATAEIFTRAALREVYRVSAGIPRVINIVCDRALLGAYTQDLHSVPAHLVRRAGGEVFGHELTPRWIAVAAGAFAAALLAGSALALWHYAPRWLSRTPRVVETPRRPAAALLDPASRADLASSTAAGQRSDAGGSSAELAYGAAGRPASATGLAPVTGSAPAAGSAPPAGPTPALADESDGAGAPAKLSQLLTTYRDSTDTDSAFTALLGLWKAHYDRDSTDGCTQAIAQGLQCLMQRGSLAQLRLLNRPAILMLNDDAGTPYQVVLRGLDGDDVQLQFGAHTADVGIADLSRYWFGDFVLLWHPAARDPAGLHEGMRGPPVRRLRYQLERWGGLPDGAAGAAGDTASGGAGGAQDHGDDYDAGLMHLVEQFQRANRLTVDGIAGIETQVVLDAVLAAPGSPLLQARVQSRRGTAASTRGT